MIRIGESHTNTTRIARASILLVMGLLALLPGLGQAQSLLLAWEPVTAQDLAGYKVYVGAAPGQYDHVTVTGLEPGLAFELPGGIQEYYLAVTAFDSSGNESGFSEEILFQPEKIAPFALNANYPNPFNPVTRIPFLLTSSFDVTISIYDVRGRFVKLLIDGSMDAGNHNVEWDGTDESSRIVANGVYFCRMQVGVFAVSRKLILAR